MVTYVYAKDEGNDGGKKTKQGEIRSSYCIDSPIPSWALTETSRADLETPENRNYNTLVFNLKDLAEELLWHMFTSETPVAGPIRNEVPSRLSCISRDMSFKIKRPLNKRELQEVQRLFNKNYEKTLNEAIKEKKAAKARGFSVP